MKALFDALNIVYDEDEKRGFIKLNAITLLFTLGRCSFCSSRSQRWWRFRWC